MFSTMIIFPLLENIVYLILNNCLSKNLPFYEFIHNSTSNCPSLTHRIKRCSIASNFWRHFSHSLLRDALNSGSSPSCRGWLCPIFSLEPMPSLFPPQWLSFDRTTLSVSSGERVLKRLLFCRFTHLKYLYLTFMLA